jgi:ABC-type uncharacterized transport system permease subunit
VLAPTFPKTWIIYLSLEVIALAHLFSPLPFSYRHNPVVWGTVIAILQPGLTVAFEVDYYIRGMQFEMRAVDRLIISFTTLAINCILLALILVLARWFIQRRKHSRRSNAHSLY